MDVCMDAGVQERVGGWVFGWMDAGTRKWVDGRIGSRVTDVWINEWVRGQMNGRVDDTRVGG